MSLEKLLVESVDLLKYTLVGLHLVVTKYIWEPTKESIGGNYKYKPIIDLYLWYGHMLHLGLIYMLFAFFRDRSTPAL